MRYTDILRETRVYIDAELEAMDVDDLDKMAYGLVGDQIVRISPKAITLKWHDDMGNPQHRYDTEGMAWVRSVDLSEPVDLSVAQDGTIHLEDGHHRYFCATKLGKKLTGRIEIKGNPILRIREMEACGLPLNPKPRLG
jgi:hypothetical protein